MCRSTDPGSFEVSSTITQDPDGTSKSERLCMTDNSSLASEECEATSYSDSGMKDGQVNVDGISLASAASEKGPLPVVPAHETEVPGIVSGSKSSSHSIATPETAHYYNWNGTETSDECKTGGEQSQHRRYSSPAISAVSGVSPSRNDTVDHQSAPRRYSQYHGGMQTIPSQGSCQIRSWSPPPPIFEEVKSNIESTTSVPHHLNQNQRNENGSIRVLCKHTVSQKMGGPSDAYEAIVYIPKKRRVGFRSCWVGEPMAIGTCNTFSEAEQMCLSFSPPLMQVQRDFITCEVCEQVCGVLIRRKKHCKNCGRWVCPQCSQKKWPRSMLPYTYVLDKSDPNFRVCDTCYDACENFRQAILQGDEAAALQVYSMGCVNLRTPYPMYMNERPVHCAAHGGNLRLLRWLIEDRHCPIFLDNSKTVALGDKLRHSVLSKAARQGHLDMVYYLMKVQKCNISEVTELPPLWNIITDLLKEEGKVNAPPTTSSPLPLPFALPCPDVPFTGAVVSYASEVAEMIPSAPSVMEEAAAPFTAENECIVCFQKPRDCTMVPCGHLACCYDCGLKLTKCCVCQQNIDRVIKTYSRP